MCIRVSSSSLGRVALVLSPHACLLSYGLVLPRARGERLVYTCGVNVSWPLGESCVRSIQLPSATMADAMFPRNMEAASAAADDRVGELAFAAPVGDDLGTSPELVC